MPAKSPESLQAIICSNPHRLTEAAELAEQLDIPLLESGQGFSFSGPFLEFGEHLQLCQPALGDPVWVDFDSPALYRRLQGGRRQPLARACGLHKRQGLKIIDCTAGMGQDMLTLAAAGANVTPLERNPVVFQLLKDGFARGAQQPVASQALARCETPRHEDAKSYLLTAESGHWDVIYLDPMFSGYQRRALPKKNMQLLASICGGDEDIVELLPLALRRASQRVVVKRSPQAPVLGTQTPHYQVKGNRVRYDVYLAAAESAHRRP